MEIIIIHEPGIPILKLFFSNLVTSFPLSIGIRWYMYIINHLQATGGLIRGLRPDERSVASRLHDALEAKGFRAGGFTSIFSLHKICWLIYDHVIGILSNNSLSHFRD